jgi:nucleoside 2-deoxyribosyltransferase
MIYHARIQFGRSTHYWWNYEKHNIIKRLVIPFVNGQVVPVTADGITKIMNLKSVTMLSIYKTRDKLSPKAGQGVINQMRAASFQQNACTAEILSEIKGSISSLPTTSLLQKALQQPKNQVFTIMKIGDAELDSAYEGVYKPVCEEFHLRCIRIDEIQDSGQITDQILEAIAESKYIVADLSGERPNCYYETGFAHALGKELVLCIKTSNEVHFDLAGFRFIQWSTEAELRTKLKERIGSLEERISRNKSVGGPIRVIS